MSPEFHSRVRTLFEQALERTEAERLPFLKAACAGDQETFQAVERLLNAREMASSFLETESLPAQRAGRYVISRELGRGAMGVVYEALDPLIGRTVAVKIIRLESLTTPGDVRFLRDRLFREARSAGSLSHPGIVTIFDVGQEANEAFIAMERVNGPSLAETLVSTPRLDHAKALNILRQMAIALDHAHRHGVIHRDIKPANIMLDQGVTVKITDFGIAKVVSDASQTLTSLVMGTPSYMSPEQIEAKPLDGRSDQFSLAAVAYQLLTGAVPFQTDSLPSLLHQIVYAPRPSAHAASPTLPAGVDGVLARALARNTAERYSSCTDFVEALESAMPEEPVVAPKVVGKARRPMAIAAAASAVVAVAVVAFVFVPGRKQPPGNRVSPSAAVPPVTEPPPAIPLPTIPARTADISAPEAPPALVSNAQRALQIYNDAEANRTLHPDRRLVLLRQAAELGESRAMNELAESLVESRGVDDPEALQWFHIAADKGNASAMVHLGVMSLLGTGGVNKDPLEAAGWFGKAANAGSAAGMYDLATMYDDGQGIPEDPVKAKDLYRRAAALGHPEAKQRLAQMSK